MQAITKNISWEFTDKKVTAWGGMRMFNPEFALGFEENGLNLCQNKACEQKYHSRTRCSTARTLLRVKRSNGKELETFYQNPNANSGIIAGGFYF